MDTYFIVQLILAFLIGWFGSAVCNYVLSLGRSAMMVRHVGYTMACFAMLIHDQVVEFLEVKYKSLDQLGVTREEAKKIRIQDRSQISDMKKIVVNLLIELYPANYKHQINFENWNQMVNYISKNQRRYDA